MPSKGTSQTQMRRATQYRANNDTEQEDASEAIDDIQPADSTSASTDDTEQDDAATEGIDIQPSADSEDESDGDASDEGTDS